MSRLYYRKSLSNNKSIYIYLIVQYPDLKQRSIPSIHLTLKRISVFLQTLTKYYSQFISNHPAPLSTLAPSILLLAAKVHFSYVIRGMPEQYLHYVHRQKQWIQEKVLRTIKAKYSLYIMKEYAKGRTQITIHQHIDIHNFIL